MNTTTVSGRPVDAEGRLVHEDDLVAQIALALAGLEGALVERGLRPDRLTELRVLTTDVEAAGRALDVLSERLRVVGTYPTTHILGVTELGLPGMLVALEGTVSPLGGSGPTEGFPMSTTHSPVLSAEALRGLCEGRVHLPGDAGYDTARLPWNVAVDQRPAAVVVPRSAAEVIDVVVAAAAAGLRVAPQSTGHAAAPLAEQGLADVVLLRLHELTGVVVDADRRTARVLGGTLWRDVVAASAPLGLTALHGSAPDVAVAGYVLGGGLSFYARQHGLASSSVTAIEVVTGDGSLVRCSSTQNEALFWALRGGGGNFGVVVAIELDLLPLPDVFAGMLLWDIARAPDVVRTWVALTRTLPESVTTSLRVMSFPPLPELPPFLSGRRLVVVDGAVLEDDARAADLLAPLRALAPEIDTFARIPTAGVLDMHMDPPGPSPAVSDHAMLGELDEAAVEAFLDVVGPTAECTLTFAELRHLGGALARPSERGGVLSRLHGSYALFCVAMAPVPEAATAGLASAAAVLRALTPWSLPSRALNFTENRVDASSAYEPEDWVTLCELRDRFDPKRLMVSNHPL